MTLSFPVWLLSYVDPATIYVGAYGDSFMLQTGLLFLDRDSPLEEQVLVTLSELLRFHPKYNTYALEVWEDSIFRDESVERQMRVDAVDIYAKRPHVAELIARRIETSYRATY